MLIRSQDKTRIRPLHSCLEIYVRDCYVRIDGADYGEYSTQEKAIKVLDMIESKYTEGNEWLSVAGKIFKMPQDNEVKLNLESE